MSQYYDATMTKDRMSQSYLGCALLEQMAITDLSAQLSQVEKTIADKQEFLRHYNAKARKLRALIKQATTRKQEFESNIK